MTPLEIGLASALPSILAGMFINNSMNRYALAELRRNAQKAGKKLPPEQGGEYEQYICRAMKHPLTLNIGPDEMKNQVFFNVGEAPHVLIGGVSGTGKSNLVNHFVTQLLARPATQVRLCLIDLKRTVEFVHYEDASRHLAQPIAGNIEDAVKVLDWYIAEMNNRYDIILSVKKKKLDSYNEAVPAAKRLPHLVLFADEVSQLILKGGRPVIERLMEIGNLGRASGTHMILATQYPKEKLIASEITVNCGARIALRMNNGVQSRVILDENGAEDLRGEGKVLFSHRGVTRMIQTPFISDEHVESAVQAAQPKLRRAA